MRLVGVLLSYLLFWLLLPALLLHPKLRDGIKARLGFYPRDWPNLNGKGPRIWLHGASAGDILALLPLARELRAKRPDVQIIVSTITNSGRAIAERERDAFSAITYMPYDLPGVVRRALKRIAPDVLVLEYTELWPHLIRATSKRHIPVVMHNGRFSPARLSRYRWLFAIMGNLLRRYTLLLMRSETEADSARLLGAPEDRLRVTGNTKFDNLTTDPPADVVDSLRRAAGFTDEHTVWVAGSTHDGEEGLLLDILVALRETHPSLRMIVAPRYAERADKIKSMAEKRGLSTRLRSKPGEPPDVFILDTIGELAAIYMLGDLVFVGGSFVERGGQNILEPAVCGKPVLFGPHMENFADSVQVLLGRGGVQVASPEQLQRVMADLLVDADHRRELGEMAVAQVTRVRGAAARNAEAIVGLLR
ncbi:MAG: 3-deoxy-D-manno-octulosonic acid transferase [Myxococcota bacterium]